MHSKYPSLCLNSPIIFLAIVTFQSLLVFNDFSVIFQAEFDGNRFLTDLARNVGQQIAFDCMVRIRTSAGKSFAEVHLNCDFENFNLLGKNDLQTLKLLGEKPLNYSGIRPCLFSGSFYMENSTDLEMASIDENKAFFAEIKHDDKLSDSSAVIQVHLLSKEITFTFSLFFFLYPVIRRTNYSAVVLNSLEQCIIKDIRH